MPFPVKFLVILPANNAPFAVRIGVNPPFWNFNLGHRLARSPRITGRQGHATDIPECKCVKEVRSGKTRRHFTGRVFFSWDVFGFNQA